MALLPAVKHERNLVVAHSCRKTAITLLPYRPHVTVNNVQANLHTLKFNATESDGKNGL